MSIDIEQLRTALKDALLEQDKLRQQLAEGHRILAELRAALPPLQALARELQADAPPAATPWQQADGWEGRQ